MMQDGEKNVDFVIMYFFFFITKWDFHHRNMVTFIQIQTSWCVHSWLLHCWNVTNSHPMGYSDTPCDWLPIGSGWSPVVLEVFPKWETFCGVVVHMVDVHNSAVVYFMYFDHANMLGHRFAESPAAMQCHIIMRLLPRINKTKYVQDLFFYFIYFSVLLWPICPPDIL